MQHAVRNILLFLSVFFAFFGLQNRAAMERQALAVQLTAAQNETPRLGKSERFHAADLRQTEEQLRVWQPRPLPPLKQAPVGAGILAWALELDLQLQAAHYLQRAGLRCIGLSGCDIIFPFHYFW